MGFCFLSLVFYSSLLWWRPKWVCKSGINPQLNPAYCATAGQPHSVLCVSAGCLFRTVTVTFSLVMWICDVCCRHCVIGRKNCWLLSLISWSAWKSFNDFTCSCLLNYEPFYFGLYFCSDEVWKTDLTISLFWNKDFSQQLSEGEHHIWASVLAVPPLSPKHL